MCALSKKAQFHVMKWLRIGLTIVDAVSRVVDRIGPVSFEPMEKHPPPQHRSPTTADPRAEYTAEGKDYESDEEHEEKFMEPMEGGAERAPDSPDES